MSTSILGLGTATPAHRMSQGEALAMFTDIVCADKRQARLARALFKKSDVQNRHTVVPHQVAYNWCQPVTGESDVTSDADLAIPSASIPKVESGTSPGPTTRERMELYSRFASDLAVESASAALAQSGIAGHEITHLITVSCTGFDAPGVDIELIQRLGLPNSTQRINVGFMGCHGAINGMRAALGFTGTSPAARVLLCAVELCSLHYRFTWDGEGVIGNALFADGSASLVLAQESTVSQVAELAGWQLVDTGSVVITDSQETMSWRVGDHGFEMRLTSEVGDKIEQHLAGWLCSWLEKHDLTLDDIDYWGVHPGGPRILSAVQNSLDLDDQALGTSRSVLAQNGNMSSPTVLFILEQFLAQQSGTATKRPTHCILLGFGPGLVAEIALLTAR
jgi:predicted naringenin-chalcone synthase